MAIDLDRSGTAGDTEAEILVNDNTWTNALGAANNGSPIVEVEFQDIAEGGEWLAIEVNTSEGGGGDGGILYWDADDVDDIFPLEQGEGVNALDAEFLQIPDTNLQSREMPAALLSGDILGAVSAQPTGWEIDVDPSDGSSDVFGIENPDSAVFTTILDVEGLELHINPLGDVEEGASFNIFDADSITGTPIIATEGWNYDAISGSVVFGEVVACDPNSMGDLDGSGTVDFADFLVLSGNFGNAVADHSEGDIDCSGTVDFSDFLALSGNFGNEVAGAESVPEPTGFALLGMAAMMLGYCRRRR